MNGTPYAIVFYLNISYVSFLIIFLIFLNQSSLVISPTFFEAVKELYKFHFPILIYTSIGNKKIRIIYLGSRKYLHLLFVGK